MSSNTRNQIQILGSGTSTGIPIIGCDCPVCHSSDPKDKRLRTSAYLTTSKGHKFLIDAGPDLRAQFLREKLHELDAVFITHTHADHVHGIDDLRALCFKNKKNIPVFTHHIAAQELREKFPYIFMREKLFSSERPVLGGGIPLLDLFEIPGEHPLVGDDFEFTLLPHGYFKTMGITHSKMTYFTDVASVPSETLDHLRKKQLDLFIIDCLRVSPHQTHLHLEKSLEYAKYVNAKLTGLIHFSHDFFHEELESKLASENFKVRPLFDGEHLFYA